MKWIKLLFVVLTFSTSIPLFSQPAIRIVKDIALGTNGSEPQLFTAAGNQLFFAAANSSQKTFNKLWKTNGTEAGTVQVTPSKNIYVIQSPFAVGNNLFYWSNASPLGGLYKTDGTEIGTTLLISNNSSSSRYYGIRLSFNFNDKLFFVPFHSTLGTEPHISDGTLEGTFLLKDIATGTNVSSSPSDMTQVGTTLYFTAQNESGRELWKSDGTSAGTQQVIDINPGSGSSFFFGSNSLIAFKDSLFFASTIGSSSSLYKTNGTTSETTLVKSFAYGIRSNSFYIHNGSLYFMAAEDNTGAKLWKSDGTTAGTIPLTTQGSALSVPNFVATNDWLYFLYYSSETGTELWRTDGTVANTGIVKDIRTGSANAFEGNTTMTAIAETLYFMANDGVNGVELWKSNGTSEGTQLVKDINIGTANAIFEKSVVYQNQLYFVSNDTDDPTRRECWRSDGTTQGTVMLKNLNPSLGLFDIQPTIVFQDKLYLSAKDDDSGSEVWIIEGNVISQLKEINTLPADANPNQERWGLPHQRFTGLNNTLFFSADNIRYGRELWMTKGTAATTRLVKDFTKIPTTFWYNSTNTDSFFNDMIVYKNHLFVIVNGNQLWKIDEEGNTNLLLENYGSQNNNPECFTLFKGELYFKFGFSGSEFWRTNGTACTRVALPVRSAIATKDFLIYFVNNFSNNTTEIWKINDNGTAPQKIKDGLPGYIDWLSRSLELDSLLLFPFINTANTGYTDYEIWRTDGTSEGTYLLKNTNPNGSDGVTGKLVYHKNMAYFRANDGNNNPQIWSTDGTTQGTQVAFAFNTPANRTRMINFLDAVNGQLIFHSYVQNILVSESVYRSDGTPNVSTPISNDKFFNMYAGFSHNQKYYFYPFSGFFETDAFGIQSIQNRSISGTFEYKGYNCAQSHNGAFYFMATSPQYGSELFVQEAEILPSVVIKDNPEKGQYIKYQATGPITATNQPMSYSTNNYQSNTSVTLEPGFETKSNANFTAEITPSTPSQPQIDEIKKAPSLANDLVVPTISRYEIEPVLSQLQNAFIYQTFKNPDVNKPMPIISVSKEKLENGQIRYTFIVVSEGKKYEESVEVFE